MHPTSGLNPLTAPKIQYAPDLDSSTPLNKSQVTPLQQVIGTLLYYSIAVDLTMLVALGTIAAAQSNATNHTATAVVKLRSNQPRRRHPLQSQRHGTIRPQ
jgi:hypothetical protein